MSPPEFISLITTVSGKRTFQLFSLYIFLFSHLLINIVYLLLLNECFLLGYSNILALVSISLFAQCSIQNLIDVLSSNIK